MNSMSTIFLVILLTTVTMCQLHSQSFLYHGYQQESNNNAKKYPMIGIGYGNSYGGLGGQVAYKFSRLALHAGVGYFDPSQLEGFEWMGQVALYNVGAKYYITNKENLYVDLSLGTYGVEGFRYWNGHEYYSDWAYMAGPVFSGGIDYFFLKNFGVNLGLGMGANLNHQGYAPDIGVVIVGFDLGFVFRIPPK